MNTYINFMFWWFMATLSLRAVRIVVGNYPISVVRTVSVDFIDFLLGMALFIWVALLKYGVVT
jgi:hypothetical protein